MGVTTSEDYNYSSTFVSPVFPSMTLQVTNRRETPNGAPSSNSAFSFQPPFMSFGVMESNKRLILLFCQDNTHSESWHDVSLTSSHANLSEYHSMVFGWSFIQLHLSEIKDTDNRPKYNGHNGPKT